MTRRRVCILLMDSLGIGASLDAVNYNDQGADTLGHIIRACNEGKANQKGGREGVLAIPNLAARGLYHAHAASTGIVYTDLTELPTNYYGYAVEQSLGKDTPSGHWELAGVSVMYEWGYFPDTASCFPEKLINELIKKANLPGVLGLKHSSGTTILDELGAQHLRTGKPIIYTSADSVFQIAAHETSFGLQRLYEVCQIARELVDEYNIGRVIARPFMGEINSFKRTGNRRDYATLPPAPTLLDKLKEQGRDVIAIGKIADIFAHQGITQTIKADGNQALFDATLEAMKTASDGSLIFTNFVDFDSSYGHRRDIAGYANALEEFDARLPELLAQLHEDDMIIISADHGCDPSFPGSDHTREHVPILAFGPKITGGFIGRRDTFADIGQSIAEYLMIDSLLEGVSFLK